MSFRLPFRRETERPTSRSVQPPDAEGLAELLDRLRSLEDHVTIGQVLAAYGPHVDSLTFGPVLSSWTDDAIADAGEVVPVMSGHEDLMAMFTGDLHQALVARGCAHIMSNPYIQIQGDQATALGYHVVLVHHSPSQTDDEFSPNFGVWRATASRWDLRKVDGQWQVERRVHRLLDGTDPAREVLRRSLRRFGGSTTRTPPPEP